MTVVCFIRHGQSTANVDPKIRLTNPDSDLTELGKKQSIQVGQKIKTIFIKENIEKITNISSRLERSIDTARYSGVKDMLVMGELNEYHESWDKSWCDYNKRINKAVQHIEKWIKSSKDTDMLCIFSHRTSISLMLEKLLFGIKKECSKNIAFKIKNGNVVQVKFTKKQPYIVDIK
jgi:broad specificity phosphatase PhoE